MPFIILLLTMSITMMAQNQNYTGNDDQEFLQIQELYEHGKISEESYQIAVSENKQKWSKCQGIKLSKTLLEECEKMKLESLSPEARQSYLWSKKKKNSRSLSSKTSKL